MQKITPFLWFDGNAQEAAAFYKDIFPDARISGGAPGPEGKAMVVTFELAGQNFIALNGGYLLGDWSAECLRQPMPFRLVQGDTHHRGERRRDVCR